MKEIQFIPSMKTSIMYTGAKLPRAYRADIPKGKSVLDYGCGRCSAYLNAAAKERGWKWTGYDPYWCPNSTPEKADFVICSNVLNVIAEDAIVEDVIESCISFARETAVFSIYEGNGSGVGRETMPECWQRNEKASAYVARISRHCQRVEMKGGLIYAYK